MKNKTYNKKKMLIVFLCALIVILGLTGRLVYLMVFDAEYYQEKAKSLHEREREIKAARGEIIDRNGTVLATNKTVCTISVIHSQIKEPERVIKELSSILGLEEETVSVIIRLRNWHPKSLDLPEGTIRELSAWKLAMKMS